MKRTSIAVLAGVVVVAAGAGLWLNSQKKPVAQAQPSTDAKIVMEAAKAPESFVVKNEKSKDVKVQTQVTRARMNLAYKAAGEKNFKEARQGFINASLKHEGTEAMSPEFGTLSDQAAYQAIVCLEASGNKAGAKREYRKFMEERKFSPLVHMCFRRLERINGKNEIEDETRILNAINAQETRIRFETSVCGPKCLEKVLPLFGKKESDYKTIAKLAGTTDNGTTMDGLKEAAEKLGLKPIGLELNSKDFNALTKPALWLQGDHFVVVLKIENGKAKIYDPRFKLESDIPLTKDDDIQFRAIVLAFEVPTTELVSDLPTKPSKKS